MSDNKDDKSSVSVGNVQGGNVNIGSNQMISGNLTITLQDMSRTVDSIPVASASEKKELVSLLDQLRKALNTVPDQNQKDAEKITKRVEELVDEVSAKDVDKDAVNAKANLLTKAAENVKEVIPIVAKIATNIVLHILKMGT